MPKFPLCKSTQISPSLQSSCVSQKTIPMLLNLLLDVSMKGSSRMAFIYPLEEMGVDPP